MNIFAVRRLTLSDLYQSQDFDYQRFGTSSDDWLRDPDRMERKLEAAEHGSEGSYHAEIIDDWQEFLDGLTLPGRVRDRIQKEIDECREWHRQNGSLWKQVG